MAERQPSISKPSEREFFSSRRIVVTGMGMITPLGLDVRSSWQRLIAGESGLSSMPMEGIKASVFGTVNAFNAESVLGNVVNPKELRRISRSAQFALAASIEAMQQAGIFDDELQIIESIDRNRFGVQIGTGVGGTSKLVDIQKKLDDKKRILPTEILTISLERVSTIPSLRFGLRGPNETPSAACATGNIAIAGGCKEILLNQADIMLVGGVEAAINPASVVLFDAMPALSREEDPNRASKPFDVARDGFVYAEGAGALVIESEEHAVRRGAHILAYISGFGNTADASHDTAPSGEGARRAMGSALQGVRDVQSLYINAHGTATKEGDLIEIEAIKDTIPDDVEFAVSSTKGATGHTLGAAGAIEAIFCVKALETGTLPPTVHHQETMEEAKNVNIIPNNAQKKLVELAMNNSFGFGGINSVITLFKRES